MILVTIITMAMVVTIIIKQQNYLVTSVRPYFFPFLEFLLLLKKNRRGRRADIYLVGKKVAGVGNGQGGGKEQAGEGGDRGDRTRM